MTTPTQPSTDFTDGIDLPRLQTYLLTKGVEIVGELSSELISGGKSNLTIRLTDGTSRWIVRRPPLGYILPGAHNMSREYRVQAALASTDVRVPRVVALCDDSSLMGAPFYVMQEVAGEVIRVADDVAGIAEAVRHDLGLALVDTLADLHDVDYQSVGLEDLGRPDGYLQRQVQRWNQQYEAIKVRNLPHIDAITKTLHRSMPAHAGASVVHGDYRLDNVMVDRSNRATIVAVLDWEMATLGDPLADLGTLLMFWDEVDRPANPITRGLMAFPGFPTREEATERYLNRRSAPIEDLDWYMVFAEFKLAIILEQIHARHLQGQTRGEGFEGVGEMVTELLASARDTIAMSRRLKEG